MEVRVRFAPSPTGSLHIGSVRTCLFNWLFAKNKKGTFILRIEDTDKVRSKEESTFEIINELKWLGLTWDEGPFFQSERLKIYQEYINILLKNNKAYYCYCSEEELEKKKQIAKKQKRIFKYDGKCRNLTSDEIQNFEKQNKKKTIRFRQEEKGIIKFNDLIHGEVKFESDLIDDFIIMKSDGLPVYNFACVIDDYLMKINYVIRGDDHISNTTRQILLYDVFNFPLPNFAHIPMILGEDKTRLSKRHGATSISFYREKGYVPEALINYLARLGWAYDDKQEIFSQDDLIEKFSLEKVSKNPAVFNIKKLDWLNGHYIRKKSLEEFTNLLIPYWKNKKYLKDEISDEKRKNLTKIAKITQERIKYLEEIIPLTDFFFEKEISIDENSKEILKKDYIPSLLKKFKESIVDLNFLNKEQIEKIIVNLSNEYNIKNKDIIHPLRVVLTGKKISPPLFETMEILGVEKIIQRIEKYLEEVKDD